MDTLIGLFAFGYLAYRAGKFAVENPERTKQFGKYLGGFFRR
jgi:hypothetical protein